MLLRTCFLAALVLAACQGHHAAPAHKKAAAAPPAQATAPPAHAATPPARAATSPAPAKKAAAPALPKDPKKLELARKKAILAGNYALALKVCAAEKVKSLGKQAILSCVLSACRRDDEAKAVAWGGLLSGALKTEARKVCAADHVSI